MRNTPHTEGPITDSATTTSSWPSDFAKPRDTALIGFCLVAWGGILSVLSAGNSLLQVKQALLVVAGARLQPLLGGEALHSTDIAVVLFGAMLVVAGGYVHVSVGLAVVLALRPWLDGFTYPADNIYFLWAILYLLGLWGVRQIRDPKPFRGGLPIGLLALYIVYGMISATTAIQLNTTYTELLLWVGYGALLLVAINGTPSSHARGVVLLGLLAGVAGQALFAYPHLAYILPWLRESLQADPEQLARWFKGATEFTPELARRFNLNRAFASMVFPNALAALLLLGIPVTIALSIDGWRSLFRSVPRPSTPSQKGYAVLLAVAVPLFVTVLLSVFALGILSLTYRLNGPPWFGSRGNLNVLSVIVAAVPTVCFLLAGRSRGAGYALRCLQAGTATLFTPIVLGALWITYSRGAMLALLLASIGVACMLWWARRDSRPTATKAKAMGVLSILAVLGAIGAMGFGVALPVVADNPAPAPSGELLPEGMDISMAELANPASFAARIGYWRVALRIVADHPLLGVGLGNFGMAYGPAQDLDAGDVRNAHSVILQNLCEVGIPGLLLFMAFWGVFLWQGAKFLFVTGKKGSMLPLGLFVGLVAFLIHALIDINFSHPSLVMMAMAALGLFYSGLPESPAPARPRTRRVVAMLLVTSAAVAAGLMMRPYVQALGLNGGKLINVSNRSWVDTRQKTANFFLSDVPTWAMKGKADPPPRIPLATVVSLLPERDILFKIGRVLAPDPQRRAWVEVDADQSLPPNGVLEISRPWDAHALVMERTELWVKELAFLDTRFPYDPNLALRISRVYKSMLDGVSKQQADRKDGYLAAMESWGKEALRRSPWHKDMHQNMAWVYWTMGSNSKGAESIAYYEKALDAFKRARELGHLEPNYYFVHSGALAAIGQSYKNQGVTDEAQRYQDEADAIEAEGLRLQAERWSRGLQ